MGCRPFMAAPKSSARQIQKIESSLAEHFCCLRQSLFYRRRLAALVAGIILIALAAVRGQLVYDNGPPNNLNGSEMTRWLEADDFVLPHGARLESIRFWDYEIDRYFSGTILWQIYSEDGLGRPGLILFSGISVDLIHTVTGTLGFGNFKEYVSTFEIPPISLPPGKYWLALHNGYLSNFDTQNFFWETTSSTAGFNSHSRQTPFTGDWFSNASPPLPSELAFQITGAFLPSLTGFVAEANVRKLSFTTTAGYRYRVEYKDRLSEVAWLALPGAEAVAGTGNILQVTDFLPNGLSSRFYRVTFSFSNARVPEITNFNIGRTGPAIRFMTTAGFYYRVEYKNDLGDDSWSPLNDAETIPGTGDVVEVVDSEWNPADQPNRFYRVALF